jgi:hypothetical protein
VHRRRISSFGGGQPRPSSGVAVCGRPHRHESAGAARLSVVVLVLLLADGAAGDRQDGFEQGVVAADGAVGVSVEREAVDDDV